MRTCIPRGFLGLFAIAFVALCTERSYAWQLNGVPVATGAFDQDSCQATSDGAGGAIITWMDHRGFNYDVYAQRLDASGSTLWTGNGVAVCTGNGEHDLPVLAGDGASGAYIAWKDHRGSNYDIYAQHVDGSGAPQWTADGAVVCNGNGEHDSPAIAVGAIAGPFVAWKDYRNGVNDPDIYAQLMGTGGAGFWLAQGVPVCNAPNIQDTPQFAAGQGGGMLVTWADLRGAYVNIYVQRLKPSGDVTWMTDGVPLSLASGDQFRERIVGDGAGGGIVCWDDQRDPIFNTDIYAQHILGTGVVDPAWTPDGTPICHAANGQAYSQIVSDGAGGAIVAWQDNRHAGTTDWDIYAQHVQASGVVDPSWPANGTAICVATGSQEFPAMVSDGAGGAILAWQDRRNGADFDIYAQHLQAAGTVDPAWVSNGEPVCTAANDQTSPKLVVDGAGGAIVTWRDMRNGSDSNIYAQRIYAGGVLDAGTMRIDRLSVGDFRPNPAPRGGTLAADLPTAARVSATVFDVSGRVVRALVINRDYSAGRQDLSWDGADESGAPVRAGVYMIRVTVDRASVTRRVAILR